MVRSMHLVAMFQLFIVGWFRFFNQFQFIFGNTASKCNLKVKVVYNQNFKGICISQNEEKLFKGLVPKVSEAWWCRLLNTWKQVEIEIEIKREIQIQIQIHTNTWKRDASCRTLGSTGSSFSSSLKATFLCSSSLPASSLSSSAGGSLGAMCVLGNICLCLLSRDLLCKSTRLLSGGDPRTVASCGA